MAPTRATRARASHTHHQPSIEGFGRISKATPQAAGSKKRKLVDDDVRPAKKEKQTSTVVLSHQTKATPKRKRALETPEPQSEDDSERGQKHQGLQAKKDVRKKQRTIQQPTTPGRDAFDRFANLEINSPKRQSRLNFATTITPPPELPDELHDLIDLNSSFLTALNLHFAHHATSTPVDIVGLVPSVSNIWGKRKVFLPDIQLCLGILQWKLRTPSQPTRRFTLSDYGRRKVCIETIMEGEENGIYGGYIDENKLNARFKSTLTEKWCSFWPNSDDVSINRFMEQLPREEIQACASLSKVAPLYNKGQQRLAELKAGITSMQSTEAAKKAHIQKHASELHSQPEQQTHKAVESRASSLLDRILAKQQINSNAPAPLSREQQNRNRALQRCEEIASTISLMAAGKGGLRASFSLQSLVQNLQGSVRNPIAREEAEQAVELLAGPVAPGFVNIASMGSVRGVVVNMAMKPAASIMKERIQGAMAKN